MCKLFFPQKLRKLEIRNRVFLSPAKVMHRGKNGSGKVLTEGRQRGSASTRRISEEMEGKAWKST